MKNTVNLVVRASPVVLRDQRTGERKEDMIALDKAQIQAAALIGIDHEQLIQRMYNRQGFRVLDIGKPVKKMLTLDLTALFTMATGGGLDMTDGVRKYLSQIGPDPDSRYALLLCDDGAIQLYEDTNAGGGTVLDTTKTGGDPDAG